MTKRNHHYVPRFYLEKFASKPDRINICNLRTLDFYQDGSLRDQCYRKKLHGQTDELEDTLQEIEGLVAPTLRAIVETSRIPKLNSADREKLLFFIALQSSRTPANAGSMAEGFNKMLDLALLPDSTVIQARPGSTLRMPSACRLKLLL